MSNYDHPEEGSQVWAVESYADANPGALYRIEFADGERYVAEFDTAYDSDNAGELEIEMDDPRYDEFHQVVFRIVGEFPGGWRPYNEFLSIDYRDFPERIIDLDSQAMIYPAGGVVRT